MSIPGHATQPDGEPEPMGDPVPDPGGGSTLAGRRRVIAVVAVVAVLAAAGGWAASTLITSPAEAAAQTAPPAPSVITAVVERRVLQDTLVMRGQVVPSRNVDVVLRSAGTDGVAAVVTAVNVQTGQDITAGQVLLEVSGRPVIALPGDVPVFRDLRPGDTGPDVGRLQDALTALGQPVDTTRFYGTDTEDAVAGLYAGLGYAPTPASPEDEMILDAAQDGLRGAERAVEDAELALQDALAARDAAAGDPAVGTSGNDAGAEATAEAAVRAAQLQRDRAAEDAADAEDQLAQARATTGPMVPAAEIVAVPTFPAQVRQVGVAVGDPLEGAGLTLSTGALQVRAVLPPQMVGLARPGQQVELASEVLGEPASGTVLEIAAAADPGLDPGAETDPAAGGNPTPELVVTPDTALPAEWAGQDVRVTVVAASSEGEVLVVPVAAVSAGADGATRVTVQDADGTTREVPVRVGVTGAGYVAVTPSNDGELDTGDLVVVGVAAGPP